MIAGLGHDVVNVSQFAEQMSVSKGWRALFSARELRQCSLRAENKSDDEALHISARWAGKEAVIKAWCEALSICHTSYPYTLDNTPWSGIEILDDSHGCPRVNLSPEVNNKVLESLSRAQNSANKSDPIEIRWHISLTHDGLIQNHTAIASAVAILEIL